MGKKLTFAGFLLAMLCLIPAGIYTLAGTDPLPLTAGMVAVLGFPLFSLVSFIGMAWWGVTEIRQARARHGESDR